MVKGFIFASLIKDMKWYQSPKKLKYMSLFSGIGGFEVGIQNIFPNAKCVGYSEIDKHALSVYRKHFPSHPYLGPVQDITGDYKIDLLVGGSPCQDLSANNLNGKGLKGKKSKLFYEYLRILRQTKPKYFILENVGSMKDKDKNIITKLLGVSPIVMNSNQVSAQNRKRYYWTNIPQNDDGNFRFKNINVLEILEPPARVKDLNISYQSNMYKLYKQWNSRGNGYFPTTDSDAPKSSTLSTQRMWIHDKRTKRLRKIHPMEAERLQTFPDNWTESLSYTQRIKTLGNAVTCNVVSKILLNLT
jgi:site-specific DNA-cytosine methylase